MADEPESLSFRARCEEVENEEIAGLENLVAARGVRRGSRATWPRRKDIVGEVSVEVLEELRRRDRMCVRPRVTEISKDFLIGVEDDGRKFDRLNWWYYESRQCRAFGCCAKYGAMMPKLLKTGGYLT